jgi:hypothetical protein
MWIPVLSKTQHKTGGRCLQSKMKVKNCSKEYLSQRCQARVGSFLDTCPWLELLIIFASCSVRSQVNLLTTA